VDCLIEIVESVDHRLLRLSGSLTEAQVHELLDASRASRRPVFLDLRQLISVDAIGLGVLLDLQRDGAQLLEIPTYIQLKLESLSSKRRKHGR
jgi:anti-anti-sigma regulatory factor